MKTTLEIPEELYRAVKAKAAIEGKRVTDVVTEALRMAIEVKSQPARRVEVPIIKATARKTKATIEDFKRAELSMYEEDDLRNAMALRR